MSIQKINFIYPDISYKKDNSKVNIKTFVSSKNISDLKNMPYFYPVSFGALNEKEKASDLSFDDSKKRIKKIWESTLFYSIVIPLFLHFIDNVDLSIMMALPVLSNQYWFSTTYICMMLIFPFFIKAAKKCDKKQLKQLVLSLLFIDVVQPIFGYNAFSNIGYGLIHALTMITVGYYLKKENIRLSNWKAVGMYIGSIIMIGIIIIISIAVTGDRNRTIADYNSIFMVLASVGFFLLFLKLFVIFHNLYYLHPFYHLLYVFFIF